MFTETEKEQIINAFNELSKDAKLEYLNLIHDKLTEIIDKNKNVE